VPGPRMHTRRPLVGDEGGEAPRFVVALGGGLERPPLARPDPLAEEGLVVRRCVGLAKEGRIVTVGDDGVGSDTSASETAVAGLVVAVERFGRRVDRGTKRGVVLCRTAAGLARSCRANARELLRRLAG